MYEQYLIYEGVTLKSVRCMRCGKEVRTYVEGEVTTWDGKKIKAGHLIELPDYARGEEILVETGDSRAYLEPILCKSCLGKKLDPIKIIELAKDGWRSELEAAGCDSEYIKDRMQNSLNYRLSSESAQGEN